MAQQKRNTDIPSNAAISVNGNSQKKAIEATVNQIVKSDDCLFNERQVQQFYQPTPKSKIKRRPAKGGGEWLYVDGGYVIEKFNQIFGYQWDKYVLDSVADVLDVSLKTGCVTCRIRFVGHIWKNGVERLVIKEDVGRNEVKFKTKVVGGQRIATNEPLDWGNDFKGAITDGLKRCAMSLGLYTDVYSPDDYLSVDIKSEEITNRISERMEKVDESKANV